MCVNVSALLFSSGAVSVYVEAFDEIIQGPVAQYVSLSQKIGGDVQKHVCYRSHDKHLFLVFPVMSVITKDCCSLETAHLNMTRCQTIVSLASNQSLQRYSNFSCIDWRCFLMVLDFHQIVFKMLTQAEF